MECESETRSMEACVLFWVMPEISHEDVFFAKIVRGGYLKTLSLAIVVFALFKVHRDFNGFTNAQGGKI